MAIPQLIEAVHPLLLAIYELPSTEALAPITVNTQHSFSEERTVAFANIAA